MADNVYDYVNASDVSDGYHIPSGRRVHTDSKGRQLISNVGYSETDGISAGSMPASSRQPYDPNAANPKNRQTSYGASDQANKTRKINSAVGNWWQGLQQGGAGGAGAMMSGGNPNARSINSDDYSSGLESNKIVVDGVTYDMNNPEHKKLMNSRVDGKIKKQHKALSKKKPPVSEELDPKPLGDNDSVTPLNSNPVRPPRTAGEFGDFMKTLTADYGIKFPGEQQRNGYESIHLPGTDSNSDEFSAGDAAVMGMSPQQAIDRRAGGTTEIVIGGNMGAQSGSSPAADQGEAQRVVQGYNGHEFGGEHEAPATSGLDARRRAFLDYDGPGGSMMALRAGEAAQGTIKQNGELYAVGDDGKASARISEEGERALKKDGNQMASQDFLRQYRYDPGSPAESESADSLNPVMPSGSDPNIDEFSASDAQVMGMPTQEAINRKKGTMNEILFG